MAGFPGNHEQKAGCRLQGKYLFDGYSVKIFIFCLPFQRAFPPITSTNLENNDGKVEARSSGTATSSGSTPKAAGSEPSAIEDQKPSADASFVAP